MSKIFRRVEPGPQFAYLDDVKIARPVGVAATEFEYFFRAIRNLNDRGLKITWGLGYENKDPT